MAIVGDEQPKKWQGDSHLDMHLVRSFGLLSGPHVWGAEQGHRNTDRSEAKAGAALLVNEGPVNNTQREAQFPTVEALDETTVRGPLCGGEGIGTEVALPPLAVAVRANSQDDSSVFVGSRQP